MINFLFILCLCLYFYAGTKVDQWLTISILGFKLDTPQLFMTNPQLYSVLRLILFLLTATLIFGVTFDWYFGVGGLVSAWFTTTWLGQKLAFKRYRALNLMLANFAENENERLNALESARMSDAELRNLVMQLNAYQR